MDSDGFLHVLGRFKSLLISSDGEKYSPEGIEEALVDMSEFVDQAMLYNNQNPYTVALIVPSKSALIRYLKSQHLSPESDAGIQAALKQLEKEVAKFKSGGENEGMFPARWLPTNICVLPDTFNEDNKLLNTTLKMVRGKIESHYQKELNFLYTSEARDVLNDLNRENLRKFFL